MPDFAHKNADKKKGRTSALLEFTSIDIVSI
jgi:hypothetical protein